MKLNQLRLWPSHVLNTNQKQYLKDEIESTTDTIIAVDILHQNCKVLAHYILRESDLTVNQQSAQYIEVGYMIHMFCKMLLPQI